MPGEEKQEVPKAHRAGRNFAPMPLAVLASNAPPRAKLLILALYHHDWDGNRAWPSQERLARIMSCSRDTVTLAIKDCIEQEWILVRRRFSATSVYDLNIPDMDLKQFEEKLSESQLSGFTTNGKSRHQLSGFTASVAGISDTNENKEAEKVNENQKPMPAPKGKHPDEPIFWTKAKESWKAYTKGEDLEWPRTKTFQADLTSKIQKYGASRLAEFFQNHLDAPFGKKSLLSFLWDVDASKVKQTSKGGNPARAFFSPPMVDPPSVARVLGRDPDAK